MLIHRILTALVLLAIYLPALFWGSPDLFNGLALVLIAAGVWEWGRMNGYSHAMSLFFAFDAFALGLGMLVLGVPIKELKLLWLVVTAVWVLVAGYLLLRGVPAWPRIPKALRLVAGVALLLCTWLAVAQLREIGLNLLLSALLWVWAADILAYVFGKWLGKRKLAPSISPGKSWEGVAGGLLGVVLVALFWIELDANVRFNSLSIYSLLWERWGWAMALPVVFGTLLAVVGDLIESLVKRAAGVKDSSHLLPGHGGVLDRVDALLPVLPMVMFFVSVS